MPISSEHGPRRLVWVACLCVGCFLLAPALNALPQAEPAESTESAVPQGLFAEQLEVRVINVDVVVSDASGQPVAGLEREQFVLRVDGKVVPVGYFYSESTGAAAPASAVGSIESAAEEAVESLPAAVGELVLEARPSYVVIMVDHSRLRPSNRRRAFDALRQALDRLGENDRVAVVGVEGGLVFYSDFLVDKAATARVLDEIANVAVPPGLGEIERRQIFGELARGISGGIQARTSLADPSILQRIRSYAAEEYARGITSLQQIERVVSTLAGLPGRKTLLYVGEGVPTRPGEGLYIEYRNRFAGSQRGLPHQDFNTDYNRAVGNYDLTGPMQALATAANRAGVTLHSIDAAGNHGGEIRSALTEQGATSEAVTTIDENYREPLEYASKATGGRLLVSSGRLEDQLVDMIGGFSVYYSLGFEPPAGWNPGSDHDIRVEVVGKGLVVRHPESVRLPASEEREAAATVAALMYRAVDNPLEIRATPGSLVRRDDGAAALPVQLEIPIARIDLLPHGDSLRGSLTIYVGIKDASGNPGRVQKVPFQLAIPAAAYDPARGESAHYTLPIVVRQGDRQVAIAVRDDVSGRFSAIRLDLAPHSRF